MANFGVIIVLNIRLGISFIFRKTKIHPKFTGETLQGVICQSFPIVESGDSKFNILCHWIFLQHFTTSTTHGLTDTLLVMFPLCVAEFPFFFSFSLEKIYF